MGRPSGATEVGERLGSSRGEVKEILRSSYIIQLPLAAQEVEEEDVGDVVLMDVVECPVQRLVQRVVSWPHRTHHIESASRSLPSTVGITS